MDDTKEIKQRVTNEKTISKDVIREVLEELHILTALSPLKLMTLLKELNELVDKNEHKLILPEKGLSIAALYRNNKYSAPIGAVKTIKELKGKQVLNLKLHEGQLRLRIIEIPIRYKKRKNMTDFETLRLLCSYEVKTGDLDYEKLPSDPQAITENLIMDYVKRKQTELEVAIMSVVFTQHFVLYDEHMLNWDWGLSFFSFVGVDSYSVFTKVEQIHVPAREHSFGIYGTVENKSDFEDTCNAFIHAYRRMRIDKKYVAVRDIQAFKVIYDDFNNRIKKSVRRVRKHKKIYPFAAIYNKGDKPISATFNMSDKNARKHGREIEKKQIEEKTKQFKRFNLQVSDNLTDKNHFLNGAAPKVWNFNHQSEMSGTFQEWVHYRYLIIGDVSYLQIKMDSGELMWIEYNTYLQSKFSQKDLRQGDAITIIYFEAEEDGGDSENVFVDIKVNYQQTLDELLAASPKEALALTDEDAEWLNFPARGNEIR